MTKNCEELLIGWQEISAYLGVSVPTLKVWRDRLEMPVRAVPGVGTSKTLCTTKASLSSWLKSAFDPQADYRRHKGGVL